MSALVYPTEAPVLDHISVQYDQLAMKSPENHIDFVAINNAEDSQQPANGYTTAVVENLSDNLASLELSELSIRRHDELQQQNQQQQQTPCCEGGSDSGVDIPINATILHRGISSNSGNSGACGYGTSSSNGCLDETIENSNKCLTMSCNSSLISCASDLFEGGQASKQIKSCANSNYECCSENGSESSSVMGTKKGLIVSPSTRKSGSSVKNKVAIYADAKKEHAINTDLKSTPQIRAPRLGNLKRTASLNRTNSPAMSLLREVQPATETKTRSTAVNSAFSHKSRMTSSISQRGQSARSPTKLQKPDSLPSALNRNQSMSMQKLVQRTPSISRARTPGTPSDDGRWPNNVAARSLLMNSSRRGVSATPDLATTKKRTSMLATSLDSPKTAANIYGTIPRRRKQKSVEDIATKSAKELARSQSIGRDRMASSMILGASSSRKNLVSSLATSPSVTQNSTMPTTPNKSRRSLQIFQTKTRIYHETSVQTALTSWDIEKAFSGVINNAKAVDAADHLDSATQTDGQNIVIERLSEEINQLKRREHELQGKLQRERQEKLVLQRELNLNTERVMNMLELARRGGGGSSVSIISAAGGMGDGCTPTSEDGSGHDSLLLLESQIQLSGNEMKERENEISQLRQFCRSLQIEMHRSLAAQEMLLHEKATLEQETGEMHDFLQHEKMALCDAFKDIEGELQHCKLQLRNKDEEVKVLRDECRHLVRLNEQRRQENRTLQSKYMALDAKTKELIAQQNGSAASASNALAGLHTRLDSLVEQLVASYNISEQDLEIYFQDVGFQNDSTQPNSMIGGLSDASLADHKSLTNGHAHDLSLPLQPHALGHASHDIALSPQRNQSFIAAVISAIRNATTPSGKRVKHGKQEQRHGSCSLTNGGTNAHPCNNNNINNNDKPNNGDEADSDSTEMLDSETEPCLMMDNVLEDVAIPDSHSHNMVSSCTPGMISQIEIPSELINISQSNEAAVGIMGTDESLNNLSMAIANRQQMEMQVNALNAQRLNGLVLSNLNDVSMSEDVISCHDSVAEMPSLMEHYTSSQSVVDQVIELDTLITKLLKVLRLVQMDNDGCIQQLIVDKNKLQQHKEEVLEKMKDIQDVNIKLQDELMDATQELMLKNNDLSSSKSEIQRHRNEIDVRF